MDYQELDDLLRRRRIREAPPYFTQSLLLKIEEVKRNKILQWIFYLLSSFRYITFPLYGVRFRY